MADLTTKDLIAVVQCHLVMQRCSGYYCEKAFHQRNGGFAGYPAGKAIRYLTMTCGGCCGRALHRKLHNLATQIAKREQMAKDRIAVQFSSCIAKDNWHGPKCPHLDYLRQLVGKLGLDVIEGTSISHKAEAKRQQGVYQA